MLSISFPGKGSQRLREKQSAAGAEDAGLAFYIQPYLKERLCEHPKLRRLVTEGPLREKLRGLLRIPRLRQMNGQFRNIIYEKKDRIATIILNRPEALNALSPEMIDELISALNDAKDDKDVRVVIITGAGRAFSAGGDLNAIKDYDMRS